jgi:hypothetical protein
MWAEKGGNDSNAVSVLIKDKTIRLENHYNTEYEWSDLDRLSFTFFQIQYSTLSNLLRNQQSIHL